MPNNTIKPGDELGFGHHSENETDGPVECLGLVFENDQQRREHYLALLAVKLKDSSFRNIEGFPLGEDEDILELSDPPYYTACPNPFIGDFITYHGRAYDPAEKYKREPYAADVSEGKNDPIYNAHSYHTKVPHKAIMRYILHYTAPGDIVYDGFCGTGMTGVAAQLCADRQVVESLGYRVLPDGKILKEEESSDGNSSWIAFTKLGARKAVLNDLAPAATFISYHYNSPVDVLKFETKAKKIIEEVRRECGWMYETKHKDGQKGVINYTIWSDVFSCPECASEVVFWEAALDHDEGKVKDTFACLNCNTQLTKRSVERAWETEFDLALGETIRIAKRVPVLINYSVDGVVGKFEKKPEKFDLDLILKIQNDEIPYWYPKNRLIEGKETRRNDAVGLTHDHQFYTKRNLWVLAASWERLMKAGVRFPFLFTASQRALSKLASIAFSYFFHGGGGFINAGTKGTLYVPSTNPEVSVFNSLESRIKSFRFSYKADFSNFIIDTSSTTESLIQSNSLDYLFIDPPFGANINYSELNSLWEPWLGVQTNIKEEAIENSSQNKGIFEYKELMTSAFKEAHRVLKPGRWMTVEFSNTKASVWNSIQAAITEAGFIVANVSALDKKQGSFKVYTTPTAVKQDLVISAYKPNGGFENRFSIESDDEGAWDFIRTHLGYLPVVKKEKGELAKTPERDPRILFDQLVAYFVRNLRDVPISSKEFQEGLLERFAERDGMIFLPEQVAEYDKARISSKQLKQFFLFVEDEASAIDWLRQLLNEKPQVYQDIHPKFISELSGWKKAEEQLELFKLLEQNFLKYDGEDKLPSQIHGYLSTNYKEMRNLAKDDYQLIKKAKDRWYVPNPEREDDLQKLRDRDLLKQFEEYKEHTGRKLKTVRMEAVRCGFKKAWQNRDYATIIDVAEKIPQNLLQEDQKLLMWYDQAQTRNSDESLFE